MKRIVMTSNNGTTRIDPDFCTHERRLDYETGGVFLSYGEYDDNITEHTVCLDCGAELEPVQIEPEPLTAEEEARLDAFFNGRDG